MSSLLLAGLTGLLGGLSFPVYSLDVCIWVALVPLLVAVRAQHAVPLRHAFFLGWFAAGVGYCVAFSWVWPSIARLQEISLAAALPFFVLFVAYHAVQVGLFAAVAWRERGAESPPKSPSIPLFQRGKGLSTLRLYAGLSTASRPLDRLPLGGAGVRVPQGVFPWSKKLANWSAKRKRGWTLPDRVHPAVVGTDVDGAVAADGG